MPFFIVHTIPVIHLLFAPRLISFFVGYCVFCDIACARFRRRLQLEKHSSSLRQLSRYTKDLHIDGGIEARQAQMRGVSEALQVLERGDKQGAERCLL